MSGIKSMKINYMVKEVTGDIYPWPYNDKLN